MSVYRIDGEWQIPDRYTPFFPLLPGAYFEIVIFIEGQCTRVRGFHNNFQQPELTNPKITTLFENDSNRVFLNGAIAPWTIE